MRCDLHVHTLYSGPVDLPLLRHVGRECHSTPEQVYETAHRRGMDLVTITDHDTIDGALTLAGRDDFFVSEELSLRLDGGRELRLGVFDIDERQHARLQRRADEPEALFAPGRRALALLRQPPLLADDGAPPARSPWRTRR